MSAPQFTKKQTHELHKQKTKNASTETKSQPFSFQHSKDIPIIVRKTENTKKPLTSKKLSTSKKPSTSQKPSTSKKPLNSNKQLTSEKKLIFQKQSTPQRTKKKLNSKKKLTPQKAKTPLTSEKALKKQLKISYFNLKSTNEESVYLSTHCTECNQESEPNNPDTLKLQEDLAKELKNDRLLMTGSHLTHDAAENTLQIFLKNIALNSCVHFLVQNNKKTKARAVTTDHLIVEKTPYNLLCVIGYVNNLIENGRPIVSPFKENRLISGFEIDFSIPCEILKKTHTRASLIELLKKKSKLPLEKLNKMRKGNLCQAASELSIKAVVDKYKKEYEEIITAPNISTPAEDEKQTNFIYKIYRIADSLGIEYTETEKRTFTQKEANESNKIKKGADNVLTEKVLDALTNELNELLPDKNLHSKVLGVAVVSLVVLTALAANSIKNIINIQQDIINLQNAVQNAAINRQNAAQKKN
jgi:hypothetical protein